MSRYIARPNQKCRVGKSTGSSHWAGARAQGSNRNLPKHSTAFLSHSQMNISHSLFASEEQKNDSEKTPATIYHFRNMMVKFLNKSESSSRATRCHRWPSCFPYCSCSGWIRCLGFPEWHRWFTGCEFGSTCRDQKSQTRHRKCKTWNGFYSFTSNLDQSRSSTGLPEPPLPQ